MGDQIEVNSRTTTGIVGQFFATWQVINEKQVKWIDTIKIMAGLEKKRYNRFLNIYGMSMRPTTFTNPNDIYEKLS